MVTRAATDRERYNPRAGQGCPMGTDSEPEACGRCSMTSVVGLTDGDGESGGRNPFDGDRIELDDDELRSVSAHVLALGRLKDRLDRWMQSATYGR